METDKATLDAYDRGAADFARDWHEQPAPVDLHSLIRRFFRPGRTADIGCGSGREVAWLSANGYPATGFDASEGLLAQARTLYPALDFRFSALPGLPGVAEGAFDNVLCETVIMHLPQAAIGPSVRRLWAILKPGGTLYLSWRVTKSADQRDQHGRLYGAFPATTITDELPPPSILLDEEAVSASSGKAIHRIVARKPL
jgi:SAM-dependent methyltransferase